VLFDTQFYIEPCQKLNFIQNKLILFFLYKKMVQMEQFWNKLQSWFNEFLVQPSPNSTDASMSFLSSPGPNSRDFGVTRLLSFQKWCLHPSKEKKYMSTNLPMILVYTITQVPWLRELFCLCWTDQKSGQTHCFTIVLYSLPSCNHAEEWTEFFLMKTMKTNASLYLDNIIILLQ